jgi:hypothetical protein
MQDLRYLLTDTDEEAPRPARVPSYEPFSPGTPPHPQARFARAPSSEPSFLGVSPFIGGIII